MTESRAATLQFSDIALSELFEAPPDEQLHPVTLSFASRALERDYWRHFFVSNVGYLRTSWALLLTLHTAWIPVELVVFPQHYGQFWAIRFTIILPVLLAFGPLLFSRAVMRRYSERWFQELILVATALELAGMGAMGFLILDHLQSDVLMYGGLVYFTCLMAVHMVIRMRFIYATMIGALMLVAALAMIVARDPNNSFALYSLLGFGCAANLAGALGSYLIELYARRHFATSRSIERERERAEQLLLGILPESIAEQLKVEQRSIAEGFESVSVLFADIVGFTQLSQQISPAALVERLNALFSSFDRLSERLGAEKIKTIGDAYMVAAGLPRPDPQHALTLARLALAMHATLRRVDPALELRIGIHTGPVVAGVIGRRKFIYDLWGDTVNTAARMESHGAPGRIQITAETRAALQGAPDLRLEPRGIIPVKGKGELETWWLEGQAQEPAGLSQSKARAT